MMYSLRIRYPELRWGQDMSSTQRVGRYKILTWSSCGCNDVDSS